MKQWEICAGLSRQMNSQNMSAFQMYSFASIITKVKEHVYFDSGRYEADENKRQGLAEHECVCKNNPFACISQLFLEK